MAKCKIKPDISSHEPQVLADVEEIMADVIKIFSAYSGLSVDIRKDVLRKIHSQVNQQWGELLRD